MTHAQQGAWTRALLMGIYVVITAFPFYWMFITAFKTNSDLYTLSNNPLCSTSSPRSGTSSTCSRTRGSAPGC